MVPPAIYGNYGEMNMTNTFNFDDNGIPIASNAQGADWAENYVAFCHAWRTELERRRIPWITFEDFLRWSTSNKGVMPGLGQLDAYDCYQEAMETSLREDKERERRKVAGNDCEPVRQPLVTRKSSCDPWDEVEGGAQ